MVLYGRLAANITKYFRLAMFWSTLTGSLEYLESFIISHTESGMAKQILLFYIRDSIE